jgi:hypothetical protein
MANSMMAKSVARRNKKPPVDFGGECPACLGDPTARPKEAFIVALVICKFRSSDEIYAQLCSSCSESFRAFERQCLAQQAPL